MNNNLGLRNGEFVNVSDIVETDIFQLLMQRDRVEKSDFLRLCEEAGRGIGQFSTPAVLA